MKKLFISVPMRGRTKEAIEESIKRMHQIAEAVFNEKLEVIDSVVSDIPPEDGAKSVWCLGESIKRMSEADYYIGVHDYDFRGCSVENYVAERYGIKMYFLSPGMCDFLNDIHVIKQVDTVNAGY